ncbi:hypothetical protein C8R46DRAFT_1215550 [Mycena filopes]|nr:hypothetical protein C8R46DRAFT_1215550 [Mycena filopes]
MSAPMLPDRITPLTQAQFSETYGGSLICCMVSLPVFGISLLQVDCGSLALLVVHLTSSQTYIYYLNYPRDSKWLKYMVAVLVFIESVQTWMICHTVYHYSILSYSNPLSLIDGEWSVYTAIALGIPTCFLIQIYFARMVYLLVKKKWRLATAIVFGVLIVAQIGFGLCVAIKFILIWELPKLHTIVYWALVPLYSIRVLSDTLTATVLCLVLYDASTRSVYRRSTNMFKTLMIYAMNRFVLTTVAVIIQTCVLIAKPQSIWAMAMDFVTVHLYVNSFLATLNARNSVRGSGPDSTTGGVNTEGSTLPKYPPSRYGNNPSGERAEAGEKPAVNLFLGQRGDNAGVRIKQETFVMSDLADPRRLENKESMSDLA